MHSEEKVRTIFLVEDNRGDIRLIQEAFKNADVACRVEVARDGVAAMDYLKATRGDHTLQPDLILLDLNLPKKDGREVLAELKSDPELQHIPVVVLTTSQNEEDVYNSYDLHVNCYITKSRTLAQLFTIVKGIEEFWLKTVSLPT